MAKVSATYTCRRAAQILDWHLSKTVQHEARLNLDQQIGGPSSQWGNLPREIVLLDSCPSKLPELGARVTLTLDWGDAPPKQTGPNFNFEIGN